MSLTQQEKLSPQNVDNKDQHGETQDSSPKKFNKRLSNRAIGILLAITSGAFFTSCTVLVKLLRPLHPHFILAVRGIEQTFLSLLLCGILRLNPVGPPEYRKLLTVQGILGGFTLTSLFFAFHRLPVGDASTIIFSAPVLVMVMGSLFLREPFTLFRGFALVFMVTGGILISRPPLLFGAQDEASALDSVGLAAAFAGTFFYSVNYVVTRKLKSVHFNVVLFYYSALCALVASVNMSISGNIVLPDSGSQWLLLLILGILGAFGHSILALALKFEGAGTVSLARSLDIVLAYIFQVTIFEEIPGWTSITGAIIVLAVVIGIGLEPTITKKLPNVDTVLFGFPPSTDEETEELGLLEK